MRMRTPVFDIFSGVPDRDARWLETVEGLGASFDRMKEIAAENPGRYFIFDPREHVVRLCIDTKLTARLKSHGIGGAA